MSSTKFVLFGPAHAGKSTLAGYLVYQDNPERAEKYIRRTQERLGTEFDPAQSLAYLVDVSADERRRSLNSPKLGTSKRLHIKRTTLSVSGIRLAEVDIIDTPGAEHGRGERLRGIYYADVGVFTIESGMTGKEKGISGSAELSELHSAFSVLATWLSIRPNDPLIVAVTKCDLDGFNEENYAKVCSYIRHTLPTAANVQFVPVSVDVKNRGAHNVSPLNLNLAWYGGKSLVELVCEFTPAVAPRKSDSTVMVISKASERAGLGTIYFGKVLMGRLLRGQKIAMLPVSRGKGEGEGVKGHVRIIEQSGDGKLLDELKEGELGGVVVGKSSDRRVEIEPTTVLLSENVNFQRGRYIKIRSCLQMPEWIQIFSQVELLWLGRYHPAKIFAIRRTANDTEIGLLLLHNADIVSPLDADGSYIFSRIYVARHSALQSNVTAELIGVHNVYGVRITSPTLETQYIRKTRALQQRQVGGIEFEYGCTIQTDEGALDRVVTFLKRLAESIEGPDQLETMIDILVEG